MAKIENKTDFAHTLVNFLEKAIPTTSREGFGTILKDEEGREIHRVCRSCSQCAGGWYQSVYDRPYKFCPWCGKRIIDVEK